MEEPITVMSFPFDKWEECFKIWNENVPIYDDEMQLVISTHWASEGYWIEPKGKEARQGVDFVYIGNQVTELYERVKAGVTKAKETGLSPKLIL